MLSFIEEIKKRNNQIYHNAFSKSCFDIQQSNPFFLFSGDRSENQNTLNFEFLLGKKTKRLSTTSNSNLEEESTLRSVKEFADSSGHMTNSVQKLKERKANEAVFCGLAAGSENFNFLSDSIFEQNENAGKSLSSESQSKKDILSSLQKTILAKFSIEMEDYFRAQKSLYQSSFSEEDDFFEAILKKFEKFTQEKAHEELEDCSQLHENESENQKDEKSEHDNVTLNEINVKNSKPFFFVFDKSSTKKVKFIHSVPYVCPFPDCQRQFFNLSNWEEHLGQH